MLGIANTDTTQNFYNSGQCGKGLSRYNMGNLCYACQEKRLEGMKADDEDLVDAKGYADMLGLDSEEQLKRLARDNLLAPRIPVIRQWRWRRKDIDVWFKQKQRAGDAFRKTAMGIASNLRRCSNDPIIRAPFDTIGSKVYGVELVIGMTATGTGPVELVKIDKTVALNLLKQLPEKDFPELTGITDWADLPYDKITEHFIVKLESYY